MSKITNEHLGRRACVYIRQSTADQLLHNHESRRRQYGLADRARTLGWSTVEVIDDDLGRSGGGIARPGFERLIAAICAGDVGAVLAIEASRLARNGRDWHTLIEFCGLVGTIILDKDRPASSMELPDLGELPCRKNTGPCRRFPHSRAFIPTHQKYLFRNQWRLDRRMLCLLTSQRSWAEGFWKVRCR